MYTMGYIIKVLPFTILTNDLPTLLVVCILISEQNLHFGCLSLQVVLTYKKTYSRSLGLDGIHLMCLVSDITVRFF